MTEPREQLAMEVSAIIEKNGRTYYERGLTGKPSSLFSGLTAHSTDREFQHVVSKAHAYTMKRIGEDPTDTLIAGEAMLICERVAAQYWRGLRERALQEIPELVGEVAV